MAVDIKIMVTEKNDRSNFNYGYGTSIGGPYDNYGSDRNYNERGGYAENQFSRDSGFNRGGYRGGIDEGYNNYNDWRSSYRNDYNRDYLNYGSERGANDRAWDEFDRYNYEGRNYNRSGNFGGGNCGSDYIRSRRDYDRGDRRWRDKTLDEISSWFGDEDVECRREWDKQLSDQRRGKGINDRLIDDVLIDATEIEVNVNQVDLILTGTVNERNAKRMAEDIAEEVSGVRNVENRIRVSTSQWTWNPYTDVGSTASQGKGRITGNEVT